MPAKSIHIQINPGANLDNSLGSFDIAKGKKAMHIKKNIMGLMTFEDFFE